MDIIVEIRARTPIWTACARPSAFVPSGHWPMWTDRPTLERRTDLRRPARRAVFGALPPAARRARVAAPWAFRDDPPDDPAAPWRGPWRARAAVWTGGLSAAVRARVESAVADPSLWGAALGDNADGEVSVARLDDADGVIQALRGGAPGAP